jgi:uncharacterized protein YbaR (Trm112 family)
MELSPEHLGYLVCPVCRSALVFAGSQVACTGCGRRYPIEDGLPVLIEARAVRA